MSPQDVDPATSLPTLPTRKLRGHKDSVLCLDYNEPLHLLASGSSDGCCRLWDPRASPHATHCIRYPDQGDVLSVVIAHDRTEATTSTSVDSPFAIPCGLYTAVGQKVFAHDLRNTNTPVITTTPIVAHDNSNSREQVDSSGSIILEAADEINQLDFRDSLLLAADDTGHVQLLSHAMLLHNNDGDRPIQPSSTCCHSSNSLVTAVAQCPLRLKKKKKKKKKPGADCYRRWWVSGGTDCTLRLWSNTTLLQTLSIPSLSTTTEGSSGGPLWNPPMVHSLQYSAINNDTTPLLAAGLGDGSVALFQHHHTTLQLTARLTDAHSDAVAAVSFAKDDSMLWSAGNDGRLLLWDCSNRTETSLLEEEEGTTTSPPSATMCIHHRPHKMNWITTSGDRELMVADTTSDITLYYNLP